jgi:malto-oligosyltrehalose trehalohydrolase
VHLVLENEQNQAGLLRWYTAQWNDDLHHVLHTAATGERSGYYVEYQGDTGKLGRALAEGFAFQGEMMAYRGKPRGEPCAHLRPDAFVAFIQNHDQVGNRALGERLGALAEPAALHAVAAVYLLLPQIPMLFMGEEWNAAEAFPFFCDFQGDLADAVRQGRRREFARFPEFQDPQKQKLIPDPLAEATFLSAKLRWHALEDAAHAASLEWYRRILAVRRAVIVPSLGEMGGNAGSYEAIGQGAVAVRWNLGAKGELRLAANLSAAAVTGFPEACGQVIWREGDAGPGGRFGAWSVRWTLTAEERHPEKRA